MEDGLLNALKNDAERQPAFNSFIQALQHWYNELPDGVNEPVILLTHKQHKEWLSHYLHDH